MIQVYHNNRCGKSREAIKLLEEAGIEFEVIKYLENPPTIQELTELLKKLNYKPINLIRNKESIWISNYKGKDLSDLELIKAMVQNPILIERPIVINGNKGVIARPPVNLNDFI
jgi:arsenate reductase